MYGNEDSVGTAIKESGLDRDNLYITTKYGGGDIQKAVRTSLSKVRNWICLYTWLQLKGLLLWIARIEICRLVSCSFPRVLSAWYQCGECLEGIREDKKGWAGQVSIKLTHPWWFHTSAVSAGA